MSVSTDRTLRPMIVKKTLEIISERRGVALEELIKKNNKYKKGRSEIIEARTLAVGILKEMGFTLRSIELFLNYDRHKFSYTYKRFKELRGTDTRFANDVKYVNAVFENACICPTCLRPLKDRKEVAGLYLESLK